MIEIGIASSLLERPPYICGAYLEVATTAEDAFDIHELREQLYAQMMGWTEIDIEEPEYEY